MRLKKERKRKEDRKEKKKKNSVEFKKDLHKKPLNLLHRYKGTLYDVWLCKQSDVIPLHLESLALKMCNLTSQRDYRASISLPFDLELLAPSVP